MKIARSFLAGTALVLLSTAQAHAQFSSAQMSGMQLNGSSAFNGSSQLVLTPASGGNGSAFFGTPIATGGLTTLNATFDYYMGGGSGADGLAFVLQGNGAGALGSAGGGIGYGGIGNSIAAMFRSYVYNVEQVGINGSFSGNSASATVRGAHNVAVSWSSATQFFSIVLDGGPAVVQSGIDLASIVGPQMYVGFTAATGGATDEHRIDNLTFDTNQSVVATPEPASMVLTATGLAMIVGFRRRKRNV